MSRMSEIHADIERVVADPAFDVYRLEAVTTDLRGHHPSDLDSDRIWKCILSLIDLIPAQTKDAA